MLWNPEPEEIQWIELQAIRYAAWCGDSVFDAQFIAASQQYLARVLGDLQVEYLSCGFADCPENCGRWKVTTCNHDEGWDGKIEDEFQSAALGKAVCRVRERQREREGK